MARSIGKVHQVDQVGSFTPKQTPRDGLRAGEVGYVIAGIKDVRGAPVGDTVVLERSDAPALPGFEKVKPQVFAGLFPVNADDFEDFRDALEKLTLNDASLFYEPESSDALGFGFRCGFLGMLHMEIIQERLEREYDLDLITTAPSVVYEVVLKNQETIYIDNPSALPILPHRGDSRAYRAREHPRAPGARRCGHDPLSGAARGAGGHAVPWGAGFPRLRFAYGGSRAGSV